MLYLNERTKEEEDTLSLTRRYHFPITPPALTNVKAVIVHRALYNRRNFLHYIIPPPILGAFYNKEKIFCLLILNRLFLNYVKVESFV